MNAGDRLPRIVARPFYDDDDFRRVRSLLIETYPITPVGFNWEIRRWDGLRYYNSDPALNPSWRETIRLWETQEGKIVGVVHPESQGDAHLELHPDYRQIEEEMVIWAEENLAIPTDDGMHRRLGISVFEYDTPRRLLLESRGYEKRDSGGVFRRMRFGSRPIPDAPIADGYTLRTTHPDDDRDCQAIADILNASFKRTFHNAGEFRTFTKHAACFRSDLDLVAVAPDGSFGSYVGVPYDETNRIGIFEPVCTHPDHLRKGLARTLMLEGLRRLRAIGATDVYVGTGDMEPANRLYDSIGFTEAYRGSTWRTVLPL